MERDNGGVSSEGVFIPVPDSSELFRKNILDPLQSAYLYEESRQFFKYESAVLVKNPALEEKYNAFREKRKQAGYSEDDLKESYGFLLFDDVSKATALGRSGVLTGNSTCTTLGDPSKGVYISMYSDCLDSNRWYHGKSGYIAIIRLTKGKVNKVVEIYTQNFTVPTEGFDCHVSQQLASVSSETSSFLAFERTQYYIYERLNEGSNETARSPSAACPFAIVSFSYTDSKATLAVPQEKSEVKKIACPYLPWRGKLQIGTQFYSVGLKSTAGASMPSQLPPVVKIKRAISMVDLRHLLPKAVFETCIAGEAFLDGLYCSLCELISTEVEENSSLALLVGEIKDKDAALTFPLNDGGFLVLLHSSHFLGHNDIGCNSTPGLQGIFVFPDSRVAVGDVTFAHGPSDILPKKHLFLRSLRPAEGKFREPATNPSERILDRLVEYVQSYESPLKPGLESSPSKDPSIFPNQYDEQDGHSSSPEWSNEAWQSLKSYLSNSTTFQLPVSKAYESLAAEREEQREDLDDDVYICLSSPETNSPVSNALEDQVSDETRVETLMDDFVSRTEAQRDSPLVPENVVRDDFLAGCAVKDDTQSALNTELRKTDDAEKRKEVIPLSDDLPSELIVSITSAEQSVSVDSRSVDRNMATPKHDDFQFGGILMNVKLQSLQTNSHSDQPDEARKGVAQSDVIKRTNTKKTKGRRGRPKKQKKVPPACVGTPSKQMGKTPGEVDGMNNREDKTTEEVCGNPEQSVSSSAAARRVIRRNRIAAAEEKVSDPKLQRAENSILTELKAAPLRKKDLWNLKPVISECGRILVPHGSLDIASHIKHIRETIQATRDELHLDKPLPDPCAETHYTVEMEQEASTDRETSVGEMDVTKSMDCTSHQQNINSQVNLEENTVGNPEKCSVSLVTETKMALPSKDMDSLPSQALKEEKMDCMATKKSSQKGEILLSKLKSVLLRGKEKKDLLLTEEAIGNAAQDNEACHQKCRVKSENKILTGHSGSTLVESTSVDSISNMLSVDVFALALGLTPRAMPVKHQRIEEQEKAKRRRNLQKEDSPETNGKSFSDKPLQILRRPPSIYPRRRIKTLKKQQGISEECIKKKWWLHFQSPACSASENLADKDCSRDNLVRKTVKENVKSVCTSADGLNLLADLALGADSSQVPPQPHRALERQPERSLKECDLTRNITGVDHESILHALLRQPAARAVHQPQAGVSELVDLLMKEHAYSLAPSSSLLLGLPGTPFQASPVSGSTSLLLQHQTVYGDKHKTLHPSVGEEHQCQATKTPECLKRLWTTRQKFRHSRTFDRKDGSIQVTRQWPETYTFEPDSKFTTEMITKAIVRALHGPWDFSIQYSETERQLITHMWIGLFYSRSTARSFQDDSNFTYPCPEEFLDVPSSVNSEPAEDDLEASSFEDTSELSTPEALNLSKKCNSPLAQDPVILDLSLKKSISETVSSEPQVSEKETSESNEREEVTQAPNELKSPEELNESQHEFAQPTEQNGEATDVNNKSADEERQNNGFCTTMIPFIGPDISGMTEPQDSLLDSNDEAVVEGQEEIPSINETTNSEAILPIAALGTSEVCVENEEPSKVPLHDATETCKRKDGGKQPENRCPTPTIDEKPYDYLPLGSKNVDEILKNICETSSSSSSSGLPEEEDVCESSAVNTHLSCDSSLHADLETTTLDVLQSVNDFLSKPNQTDEPSQNKLTDVNESPDQTADSRNSHVFSVKGLKDSNKRKEVKPAVACATQVLHTESSDPDPSLKDKLEQMLGVNLPVKKTDSSVPSLSPIINEKLETSRTTDASVQSAEWSQVNESPVKQEIKQTNSQCNSQYEPCSWSQLPVMAVKSPKSNESRVDFLPEDTHKETSTQKVLTSTPVGKYTNPTPMRFENTEKNHLIGNSKNLKENHRANRLSSTDTWLPNGHYNSNSVKTELALDSVLPYRGDDDPNVSRITSSFLSISSIKSAQRSTSHVDAEQGYLRCGHSDKDLEPRTKETTNVELLERSQVSDDGQVIHDNLILSPSSSLVCTISNTKDATSVSFLEQLSKRCLQVDPTQASIEEACLIFSEKMKQLVRKSRREPTQQGDARHKLRSSCSTPMTVRFSNLDEQDISLYPLGTSLIEQTIMVDMSDRKDLQVQNAKRPRETSHTASKPLEHAGVSHLMAECARLYKEKMRRIYEVEMDLPKRKRFKTGGVHPKTGLSKHFDFCDEMKREMDETFRSKLNSLVKKSCKTRYRFFMLLTSDDVFFDATKAQLEAEGHTAVTPDEFFKDRLSTLLIVLKNEDIAEHIFQVPHLLELKRSSNVLFAGIDEPDDVINLTYQEVFTAGGIIMIDKAALESLSLCNMKKVSTILQDLNGLGKWKWMLHYRDSRRIKENARLSAEAKEKNKFLLWGQDAGILEVMPYHECDLMSRDQPDYLTCLIRLQIQNIASRHTVFITDNATDGAYERKGILTTTMNSFLTKSPSETFSV